jgi:hypothetical protein
LIPQRIQGIHFGKMASLFIPRRVHIVNSGNWEVSAPA